ncbi:PTS sorbitol transporter subunit IIA [Cutibacterium sp. WCA-380-WT-3A]|uniref:PTS sorbitol transporter subunit IIA n=1 Tax=Cutibacterium porci TaxID=2605781 RepID=A0A7K0J9I9_9ACTN|nr:PTS glucitol/sorbitol transporter subunit IIA [Cutibacterium porci]MSS46483.1 PTS sorbitol transporter subunit IIA [Cutibacterium porci]
MSVIYRNQICAVGSQAESFLDEKMLVTFGGAAPDELRDFCYALPEATSSGPIGVGDVLAIGKHRFPITAIGALAQRNLDSLGHVTLVFDGSNEPRLEGALHVRCDGELPRPQLGSIILIESA